MNMNLDSTEFLPRSFPDFWKLADGAKSTAKHLSDVNVKALAAANIESIRVVLTQYRWFTSYYAGDLAILIHKLPPGRLRSLFAEFLNEELGMGDASQTHAAMYDRFLISLGVQRGQLESSVWKGNLALLDASRHKLLTNDYVFGVGLKGMGAECLCQVYLEAVHHYLLKNPLIQAMQNDIDWTFWDIHANEADQMHGDQTKLLIEELVENHQIPQLAMGYIDAEATFAAFWENAYRALTTDMSQSAARLPRELIPQDGLMVV